MGQDRKLTYYFLRLPFKESIRILLWFDLIGDEGITGPMHEALPGAIKKARDRGIFDKFESEVLRIAEWCGNYDPKDTSELQTVASLESLRWR